jgi:hypothetical protein
VDSQVDDLEQLHNTVSTIESDLESLTKQLAKIADRTAWMERHIRANGTARVADFDTHPTSLRELTTAVRRGQSLAAQLLDEQTRVSLERTLEQATKRHAKLEELTATALEANKVLVSTPYDTSEHQAAAAQFRTAFVERKKLAVTHSEKAVEVDTARRKLAAANKLRDTHAPDIEAGKTAKRVLRTRMRTTVVEAIGDGALPPVWFSTALGVAAPHDGTDTWLDLATDVLAHRALYNITDPVLALGPEPNTSASTAERTAYRRLTHQLQNL